ESDEGKHAAGVQVRNGYARIVRARADGRSNSRQRGRRERQRDGKAPPRRQGRQRRVPVYGPAGKARRDVGGDSQRRRARERTDAPQGAKPPAGPVIPAPHTPVRTAPPGDLSLRIPIEGRVAELSRLDIELNGEKVGTSVAHGQELIQPGVLLDSSLGQSFLE